MKPLKDIYGKSFFSKRHKLHWRAPHVCKAINDVLEPKSVIDVGCATGDLVKCWIEDFGLQDSWGVEGSSEAKDFFVTNNIQIWDLRTKWDIAEKDRFDLCTCFEVAEHIEPEYASMFVHNLVSLSDNVLVSIAPPGQGGHYHVNCQVFDYWFELFYSFGYGHVYQTKDAIKQGMEPWKKKDGIRAFYQNLAFFRRK